MRVACTRALPCVGARLAAAEMRRGRSPRTPTRKANAPLRCVVWCGGYSAARCAVADGVANKHAQNAQKQNVVRVCALGCVSRSPRSLPGWQGH